MTEWISEMLNSLELQMSAIILIFGALCLYFGRIIVYPRIFKVERSDMYIHGVLFVLSYILLPGIPTFLFRNFVRAINPLVFSILLFLSFIFLVGILRTTLELKRAGQSFSEYLCHRGQPRPYYLRQSPLQLISFWVVIFAELYAFSSLYYPGFPNENRYIMIGIAIIVAFSLLTIFAMFYGYSMVNYPLSKIEYEIGNGANNIRNIKGRIIHRSDFFTVLTEDGKEHIKIDRVIHIEEI